MGWTEIAQRLEMLRSRTLEDVFQQSARAALL